MNFDPAAGQEEKLLHYCAVANAYIDAINAKDLEGILACYAEDAEVHDPFGQRDFKGKAALREFYTAVITRAQMEIVGPIRGSFGPVVATPVRAKIPGVEIDVITVTRSNDAGLVQDYSAYWGRTTCARQRRMVAAAVAKSNTYKIRTFADVKKLQEDARPDKRLIIGAADRGLGNHRRCDQILAYVATPKLLQQLSNEKPSGSG